MAEDTRAPGAIKKAQQRAAKREAAQAAKARAGRATTDAAGVLETGTAEAVARIEARKAAPKQPRVVGPIEQRARDISIRTLGGVYGKRIKGTNPEDVFTDLKGKGTMSGDVAAGIDIIVGMHREIGHMMSRRFEPARGSDPNFMEATTAELDDVARRHMNLSKKQSQVAPPTPQKRTRKFSKVRTEVVDPRELSAQTPQSVSPEVSQRMQQAGEAGRQEFGTRRAMDLGQAALAYLGGSKTTSRRRKATRPMVTQVNPATVDRDPVTGKSALVGSTGVRTLGWGSANDFVTPVTPAAMGNTPAGTEVSGYRQRPTDMPGTFVGMSALARENQPPVRRVPLPPTSTASVAPTQRPILNDDALISSVESARAAGIRLNVKDASRYESIMNQRKVNERLKASGFKFQADPKDLLK